MTYRFVRRLPLALVVVAFAAVCFAAAAMADNRQIPSGGTASLLSGPSAPAADPNSPTFPEFIGESDDDAGPDAFNGIIDRSLTRGHGHGEDGEHGRKAKANPELGTSFEGLNFYEQRFANNGNQFSVEPPDQGLCTGNGFVVETINDVMNVYDASGHSVLPANAVGGAVDLNTFFGYPAAINRTTGVRGQFVTDPSCLFDAQTQRFYMVALTLEVVPTTGAFTHVNHLDVAVSTTSNPTGTWKVYRIDVTGDGSNPDPSNACPCLGDYPHIGADANGFFVTTNAYPWDGNGFDGAQIYALSKRQLASGAATVNVTHLDTFGTVNAPSDAGATQPGFTVWPAQSPSVDSFESEDHGTEYFLSSNAADEATHPVAGTGGDHVSSQLVTWALANTSSLDAFQPTLALSNTVIGVNEYAAPPKAMQPGSGSAPGQDAPQGFCLNDETTLLFNGASGCWKLLVGAAAHATGPEVVSTPDANDTRMQQVNFANGKLWGALDTAVSFDTNPADNRAGVAWFIVKPQGSDHGVKAKVALQGTFGIQDMSLTYPAIGVTSSGRGVVAMTAMGSSQFPSAAYAGIDAHAGMGDVHIAAAGAAVDDGFTGYQQQVGSPPRPRWGDYGAAAVDGNSIWIASEYVAAACSYTTWGGPFFAGGTGDNRLGTCSGAPGAVGTRGALGNWSTRISKVTP
jgi:hypothetical protein